MAQLKDLIVYGDTKFLGDVTLDHDPTEALHAATKAYVDAKAGTGTDEKLKVAALTSGTTYLPILAVSNDSGAAATRQIDKNAQAFKYVCTPGTSGGAGGTAQLILGNSINSGYVNSATGILTLYGASIYGVDIKYNGAYINQTLLIPGPTANDQTNYFVTKVGSAAIGAADQPVYIDALGHAVLGNKNPWGLTSQGGAVYPASMKSTSTLPVGNIAVLGDGEHPLDIAQVPDGYTGNLIIWANVRIATQLASAGSTSYTINSATYTMPDGSLDELTELYYFVEDSVAPQKPTSVTLDGSGKPVLTFASSLNPMADTTGIFIVNKSDKHGNLMVAYGATSTNNASAIVGNVHYNTGTNSLIVGQKDANTGGVSSLLGVRLKNTKNGSFLAGSDNFNNSNMYSALIGQGHYNTSGPVGTTAVGKYSTITSTTQFVVGNGTSASARSNAFEVTTTGEAKAVSFTENGTSLVNKYAAKTHTHGDISSTGIITTNPGVVIASGDALLIADASVGDAIKKTSITFGTSTTTYLRNDGTWGTPTGSDTKVTQTTITGTGTTSHYPILLAYSAGQTATATNTANFTANASVTPSGDIYGNTFHYGANAYTQYNSTLKAIEFCFA